MITLATIGYGEVRPLTQAGRDFTMVVIVANLFTGIYVVAILSNVFLSGDFARFFAERRRRRMRESLKDHVIIVGFGRVGRAVLHELKERDVPVMILDRRAELAEEAREAGALFEAGDATSEDELKNAGIERARALIAAVDSDASNLVIALTARSLRPDLHVVSRVNDAEWRRRILMAGANDVISPYESAGRLLAGAAVKT
jgi:voltage-gated potassium channel